MCVGTQARGETKADLIRLADEQQIPMVMLVSNPIGQPVISNPMVRRVDRRVSGTR